MGTPLITMLNFAPAIGAVGSVESPWLYVIGSGGAVAILTLLINTVRDLAKGVPQQKAKRDADLVTQRDTAWRERDEERRRAGEAQRYADAADRRADCEGRNARRLWDYAARLRRQLFDHGITPTADEPTIEDCSTREDH